MAVHAATILEGDSGAVRPTRRMKVTRMKISVIVFAGLLAVGGWSVQGQNVVLLGGLGNSAPVQAPPAPAAASVPVAYVQPAPVVIQIIQAPAPACHQPVACSPYAPNVVYQAVPSTSCYTDPAYAGYPGTYYPRSPVIYFGRGQGYRQGYNFTHYR